MNRFYSKPKTILVFITPALLIYLIFVIYPAAKSFMMSFTEWNGIKAPQFNGLTNYVFYLFRSSLAGKALINTLIYTAVITIYQIGLGALVAIVFFDKFNSIRFKGFFQTSYFLPVVLSGAVVGQLFVSIYDPEFGLLNKVFEALGIAFRQGWLANNDSAIFAVASSHAWHTMGYQMAVMYAALKSIPQHYLDATVIDGANTYQRYRYVILPMLKQTLQLCFLMAITGGIKAFESIVIMTNGGPGTSTYTLNYLLYRDAFRMNMMGRACALAVMVTLLCLIITVITNRFVEKEKVTF